MVRQFLVWWWTQLRDLLPRAWFRRFADGGIVLVEPHGEAVVLRLRRYGREQSLGRFGLHGAGVAAMQQVLARLRDARCVVSLPADFVLERVVSLPLAALHDWQRVMGFEMDRLTPFAAHEVFWSGRLIRRDRAQGRMELLLALVPRRLLERLLAGLGQAGLRPAEVWAPLPDGQSRVIPIGGNAARHAVERRAVAWMAGLCVALAVVAVVLPFALHGWALHVAGQRIAALEPAVRQAEALRRDLLARAAGNAAIAARRRAGFDPLAVLAAVTEALPDDSFLIELSLDQGRLNMTGQSAAAARLIGTLAATPHVRNPAFSAPVTRSEAGHSDLFSIHAEAAP